MHLRPPGQRIPTISSALCVELSAWAAPGSETVIPGSTLTQSGGGGRYSALQACSIVQPASPFREELVWTLKGHLAHTKAWGSQPQHRHQHAGGKHALLTPLYSLYWSFKEFVGFGEIASLSRDLWRSQSQSTQSVVWQTCHPCSQAGDSAHCADIKAFQPHRSAALDMLRMFLLHRSHLCS